MKLDVLAMEANVKIFIVWNCVGRLALHSLPVFIVCVQWLECGRVVEYGRLRHISFCSLLSKMHWSDENAILLNAISLFQVRSKREFHRLLWLTIRAKKTIRRFLLHRQKNENRIILNRSVPWQCHTELKMASSS